MSAGVMLLWLMMGTPGVVQCGLDLLLLLLLLLLMVVVVVVVRGQEPVMSWPRAVRGSRRGPCGQCVSSVRRQDENDAVAGVNVFHNARNT
jgi:hypothetical protein